MKCCICKKDLTGRPKYYLDEENGRFRGTYKNLGGEVFCFWCAKKEAEKKKEERLKKEYEPYRHPYVEGKMNIAPDGFEKGHGGTITPYSGS